jgi:uncharacterized protein (TIGR00730 family)
MNSILVFCGANTGFSSIYSLSAQSLGEALAKKNISLIYGGGKVGLMGIVADAVLSHNGKAIGVIPEFLDKLEVGHKNLTEMHKVETMHERKAKMESLCDGIITLPGGYGSMDELFEILTWAQLGLHSKPIGILNTNGFYNFIINQLDVMVTEGFLKQENRNLLIIDEDAEKLIEKMYDFKPQYNPKWMDSTKI